MNPTAAPFNQESLNRIFTVSPKHSDRLISRESSWLEFKESFGFLSLGKYIRSAAGFANAKGGYIVYGIANSPHRLIGLKNDTFDNLDPDKLTQYLNEHFDPELHWERQLYELDGKTYGLLYFYESANKPVVCRKSADDSKNLKEGEIYYRYSGRTQTIRYPELKELIEERRKREQLLWLKHLKNIARIGIRDVGLFDMRSGIVTGAAGTFLIEENLLSQISFIREGEFNEIKGKPTLKVIGTVEQIGSSAKGSSSRTQVVKTKGIRAPDIVLAFLNSEKLAEPRSYITQICYESSAFLPLYFLIVQAGLSMADALELIDREHSTSSAKEKLKERISDDAALPVSMPSQSLLSGRTKLKIRQTILDKKASSKASGKDLDYLLDMVRTLSAKEIDESYLKSVLKEVFNRNFAKGDSLLNDKIRRAICYVDWRVNQKKIANTARATTANSAR